MIFSQNDQDDLLRSSNKANSIMNEWEELLSLRIALQKPLDLANKLPAYDFNEVIKVVDKSEQVELKECQRALVKSLETTAVSLLDSLNPTQSQSKRKFSDTDELWEDMMSVQTSLQVNWEKTMDKWATRMHYGSEKARAQLKVFNQSAWGQIESVVSEERRIMEKGRMPADESERIGVKSELDVVNQILRKEQGLDETDIEVADDEDMDGIHGFVEGLYIHPKGLGDDDRKAKKRKVYDAEVYDDRQLYSLLLKVSESFSSRVL